MAIPAGVGIVGCGLIGEKRANALCDARLVATADVEFERASRLASHHPGANAYTKWRDVVEHPDVEIVLVATTNNFLAEISHAAIRAGKYVLVEKPAARSVAEIKPLINAAKENGVKVRVGFNHRYHPALLKAHDLYRQGVLGEMMFVRGRYGHGGRIGYDSEWRAQPQLSGGGELLDQGVHLIDLARLFLGDFAAVDGFAATYFWNMPVDDNGFMLLRTASDKVAFLHASCTEWKNLFSFEIYGHNAKLQVEGLGGSYGVERLTYYRMLPEMGPPETTVWEYPRGDQSWQMEFAEFLDDIRLNRDPSPGLRDAAAALDVVERIYRKSGYDHHA